MNKRDIIEDMRERVKAVSEQLGATLELTSEGVEVTLNLLRKRVDEMEIQGSVGEILQYQLPENTKDEIDWDNIPYYYNYAVMNKFGDWFVYEFCPVLDSHGWMNRCCDGRFDFLHIYTKSPKYNGHWECSLVKRP